MQELNEAKLKRSLVNLCTSVWVVMNSFERSTPENEELKGRLAMMKQYPCYLNWERRMR